ncbi:hypothetical protein RCL1_008023 [Eukaryota sp. TZLM3-RCL]
MLETKQVMKRLTTSTVKSTAICLHNLFNGQDFRMTVYRKTLSNQFPTRYQRCYDIIEQQLALTEPTNQQTKHLLLIGQCTAIPGLVEVITESLPKCDVMCSSSRECVAHGAALYSKLLLNKECLMLNDHRFNENEDTTGFEG